MTAAGARGFPGHRDGCWQATRVTVLRYVTNFSGSPLRGIPEACTRALGSLAAGSCGPSGSDVTGVTVPGTDQHSVASSTVLLGHLVRALSRVESADDVARVIAEEGAVAAGAEFATIAVLDVGAMAAHLYTASSLSDKVARRYPAVPVDDSTPLGAVLGSGGEIWLPSLSDTGTRYPLLLEDAIEAGLAATASVALRDQHQSLIGAMGVAWAQAQAFTNAQKDQVRIVAQLAGDALGRARLAEAERAARQRIERLQQMMSALVASASLAEVTASVFQHGLLPFGASAARLVLVDQQQPERLVTVNAVGLPEPLLAQWRARPLSDASPSAGRSRRQRSSTCRPLRTWRRNIPPRTLGNSSPGSRHGWPCHCAAAGAPWAS